MDDMERAALLRLAAADAAYMAWQVLEVNASTWNTYKALEHTLDVVAESLGSGHKIKSPPGPRVLGIMLLDAQKIYAQRLSAGELVMTRILPWDVAVHTLKEMIDNA